MKSHHDKKHEGAVHEFIIEHRKHCPIVLTSVVLIGIAIHHCIVHRRDKKLQRTIVEAVRKYEMKYGEISNRERDRIIHEIKKSIKEENKQEKKKKQPSHRGEL